MLPNPRQLPLEYADLNEMSTASRGVVVLYGRRSDGSLIALQTTNDGLLGVTTSLSMERAVAPAKGSSNAFFIDAFIAPLTEEFKQFPFGFESTSITIINDDKTNTLIYSFDGKTVHGKINAGEKFIMDNRSQSKIFLKTSGPTNDILYRVMVY